MTTEDSAWPPEQVPEGFARQRRARKKRRATFVKTTPKREFHFWENCYVDEDGVSWPADGEAIYCSLDSPGEGAYTSKRFRSRQKVVEDRFKPPSGGVRELSQEDQPNRPSVEEVRERLIAAHTPLPPPQKEKDRRLEPPIRRVKDSFVVINSGEKFLYRVLECGHLVVLSTLVGAVHANVHAYRCCACLNRGKL